MRERGDRFKRELDKTIGIPLVFLAGAGRRILSGKRTPPDAPKALGVICFAAIGDLLLATALINALRARHPDARIHVYASAANAGALALLPGKCVCRSFAISDIRGIVRTLREDALDILFDTTQWARIGALVSLLSGAKFAVGFDTPGQYRGSAYDLAVPHRAGLHEIENFGNLARALYPQGQYAPSIVIPEAPLGPETSPGPETPPGNVAGLEPTALSRTIFMHMWASGRKPEIKEWSPLEWAALAKRCHEAGYRVVFTGSPENAPKNAAFLDKYIAPLLRETDEVCSIAGKTSLPELAWLFSRSAAVVSVNTGIVHLAGLSGAPTIDLHGPTAPERWGACGPRAFHVSAPDAYGGYLYLGFEFPKNAYPVLRALPASQVVSALRRAGLCL